MRVVNLRLVGLFLFGMFAMAICPQKVWLGVPATANAQEISNAQADPFGDEDTFGFSSPARRTVTRRTPVASQDDLLGGADKTSKKVTSNSPSIATRVNDEIREKLATKCAFDFDDTPYSDFAEQLESLLSVNIVLTSSASDDALSEDEPITSKLSGISHANALRIILASKNATYVVRDEVIQIISLDEANDEWWFSRGMLDATETLAMIRDTERDRIGKPKPGSPIAERRLYSGNGGGGVFALQGVQTPRAVPDDESREIKQLADAIVRAVLDSQPEVKLVPTLVTAESILLDAITKAVDSENWSSQSGQASITSVGGILIVNGPEEVIEKVDSFVRDLTFSMKAATAK